LIGSGSVDAGAPTDPPSSDGGLRIAPEEAQFPEMRISPLHILGRGRSAAICRPSGG
jgi:hypothetical protein